MADHLIKQSLLAAEVVIERGCLHAGLLGDRACRDRAALGVLQEVRADEQQSVSGRDVFCHTHQRSSAIFSIAALW